MSDSCQLYTRLLLPKRHGYPLFHPQPFDDLPLESRHIGTEIGDVGVVTADGSFDVIFNICRSANDPVNRFGVPEGFEQIKLSSGDIAPRAQYHRPGSDVSNTTISKRRLDVDAGVESNVFLPFGAGAEVEISTSSKETAVLLLPDGASRTDLRRKKKFKDYALTHAPRWYAFVNDELERMVDNGDLYLVTGTDKSSSWSVAAIENHSEDCKISLKLKAAQVGSAGTSCVWEWETANSFADSGPRPLPADGERFENQTVFLRGFKVAIRASPLKKYAKAISIVDSKPSDILSKTGGSFFSHSRSTSTGSFFRTSLPSGSGGVRDNIESVGDSAEFFPESPTQSTNASVIRSIAGGSPISQSYPASIGSSTFSNSDGASDDEGSIADSVEYFPEIPKGYHPGSTINDYLLSVSSTADVAVTHDDEWMSVIDEKDEEFPDDCELIKRICSKYNVVTSSGRVRLRDSCQRPTVLKPIIPVEDHGLVDCPPFGMHGSTDQQLDNVFGQLHGHDFDKVPFSIRQNDNALPLLESDNPPTPMHMNDSHAPSTYKSLTPQRKHRKLLTDRSGNALWSESIEAVFVQGLREYWDSPWATYSRGCSRWRNQYIVDYLQNLGITRSKKQVASHIQVLRNVWKGEPEYHLLTGDEELFQEFVKQDAQEVPAFFPIDDHEDNSSSPDNPPPFVSPNLSSWDANVCEPTFAGQGKNSKSSSSSTMVPLVWSSDPFEDSLGSGHPNAIGITVEGPQDDSDPLSQGALGPAPNEGYLIPSTTKPSYNHRSTGVRPKELSGIGFLPPVQHSYHYAVGQRRNFDSPLHPAPHFRSYSDPMASRPQLNVQSHQLVGSAIDDGYASPIEDSPAESENMTDPSSRPYSNVTQSRCPSKRNQVRNEKGPHFGPTALALEKNSSFTLSKFDLECRSTLHSVDIAYKTWGTLDAKRDNVLVICHPFTRCADVDKWWSQLMGCGKAFDPSFFILYANVLGSPFGTISPLSINPSTGRQYGPDFSPTNGPICYGQGTRDGVRLYNLVELRTAKRSRRLDDTGQAPMLVVAESLWHLLQVDDPPNETSATTKMRVQWLEQSGNWGIRPPSGRDRYALIRAPQGDLSQQKHCSPRDHQRACMLSPEPDGRLLRAIVGDQRGFLLYHRRLTAGHEHTMAPLLNDRHLRVENLSPNTLVITAHRIGTEPIGGRLDRVYYSPDYELLVFFFIG